MNSVTKETIENGGYLTIHFHQHSIVGDTIKTKGNSSSTSSSSSSVPSVPNVQHRGARRLRHWTRICSVTRRKSPRRSSTWKRMREAMAQVDDNNDGGGDESLLTSSPEW